MVKVLIELGASVQARTTAQADNSCKGDTALHLAAIEGHRETVEVLLPLQCIGSTVRCTCYQASLTEPEVVVAGEGHLVPRLRTAAASLGGLVRLHFHSRGAISNLFIEPQPTPASPGEAEVLL